MTNLDILVSEVDGIMSLSEAEIKIAVYAMILQTKRYIKSQGLKSLVVGISGGLDSAVVAAILQEKNTGVPLLGLSIPMNSSDDHREKAKWVGDNYCTTFEEFGWWNGYVDDYGDTVLDAVNSTVEGTYDVAKRAGFDTETFPDEILQGNIKARLRMITLYDLARRTNGMVLSTDNLSEYMAGFWTINGDVGDWGIIQNVWKGFELPQIAKYVGVRDDIITQKPSDGLSVTEDDTDEAQLGMTYQEFDTIISIHTKQLPVDKAVSEQLFDALYYNVGAGTEVDKKKIRQAIQRYSGTEYKRKGTVNLSRKSIFWKK